MSHAQVAADPRKRASTLARGRDPVAVSVRRIAKSCLLTTPERCASRAASVIPCSSRSVKGPFVGWWVRTAAALGVSRYLDAVEELQHVAVDPGVAACDPELQERRDVAQIVQLLARGAGSGSP